MYDSRADASDDLIAIRTPGTITEVSHPDIADVLRLTGHLNHDSAPLSRARKMAAIAGDRPYQILDLRELKASRVPEQPRW